MAEMRPAHRLAEPAAAVRARFAGLAEALVCIGVKDTSAGLEMPMGIPYAPRVSLTQDSCRLPDGLLGQKAED